MGSIVFGGGVSAISGKIGGTVYARNRAGAYARNWAKPTTTPTPLQTANRVRFGAQAAGWAALGKDVQDRWNTLAMTATRFNRLGVAYTPTGRQLYLESSNNLAVTGNAPLTDAPLTVDAPSISETLNLVVEETGDLLTGMDTTGGEAVSGWTTVYELTKPFTSIKTNFSLNYRILTSAASAGSIDLLALYSAAYGTAMPLGAQVAMRASNIDLNNGMRSPYIIVTTQATV